jgi:translation initiation factor IF-3
LEIKEIRMRLSIEPHDLEVKKSKIKDFLAKGHKVKITVILKGREMAFLNRGYEFLKELESSLGEGIKREKDIEKMGNRISMVIRR